MFDQYKLNQLDIMLNDLQTDEYALARLKSDNSKAINLDEGALELLIDYYSGNITASTNVRSKYVKASTDVEYVLTEEGLRKVRQYVKELDAKRKEILDAGKDTIDETPNPVTVEDIEDDINFTGIDEDGEYYNGWYVTDNYDADYPISLMLGVDFIEQ